MLQKNKTLLIAGILMVMALWLAACGSVEQGKRSEEEQGSNGSETEGEKSEFVMTDAMGHEVTIPADPQRIIASYLEDHLVTLGVKPVAQWSVSNGESVQQYLQSELKGVPTVPYNLPFEVVASYNPDLIIIGASSFVEGGKYEKYSQIAPTYVLGDEITANWRQSLLKIGEILQKREEAEQALEAYDKKAAEAREKLQEAIGDQSVAAIWFVAKTFYVVSDRLSSGAVLYQDLGLTAPDIVKEISEKGTGNWNPISLEKLAEMQVDHLFLINSDKGKGAEALQDPLWQGIPAVKKGNVYEYPSSSSWLYSGVIANSQMIDDVLESIVEE